MKIAYKVAFGGIVSVLLLAGVMGQAARPATHNAMATIDMAKVFSSLNQRIHDFGDLQTMSTKMNDEKAKREKELEDLQQQLNSGTLFKVDSPEYQKMQQDAMQKAMEMDSFVKMSQAKLMIEQRLLTIQIYKAISNAVQRYSEDNGIGIVLMTDEVDFTQETTTDAVTRKIAVRKVIYSHPDFDITQKVIEKMNGEYKLGGG